MPEDIIEEKTTDANGRIVWSDLKHGTYYVKETTTGADDLNDKGYGISLSSNEVMAEIPTYEAQLPGTNTGDNTAVMPYIILGAVGAGGCIAPGIAYRRKRKVF